MNAGLNTLSASTLTRQLQRRDIRAEAVLRDCLARIDAREGVVHAWAVLNRTAALERARELDRGAVTGLLHGLPVGVKDIMDSADMPTGYGSPIYQGHQPAWDAASVALTRSAGAILLGKTVTTEFAVFHPGATTNPHNPLHTPGGSSSGSAAAVADHMVPLAFATQTGGSIIRPAAYCGIVGYKPSFNTLPRAGVKPLADSLDTVGTFARSVEDAALLACAASGLHYLRLPSMTTERPRVGLCRTWEWDECDDSQKNVWQSAGALLSRQGFAVTEVVLPELFKGLARAHYQVMLRQQVQSLAYERIHHGAQLSPSLQSILQQGDAITDADYSQALSLMRQCQQAIVDVFKSADVLLVPSVTGEAPQGLTSTGNPIMNRIWTALHGPAITLPWGMGPAGLPIAVAVVGLVGSDRQTLLAAQAVEQALAQQAPHDAPSIS
jgi:Asp-tRNA(Asn)/Glu-tRNA(Gln) amidotransferase A subunit family amidase